MNVVLRIPLNNLKTINIVRPRVHWCAPLPHFHVCIFIWHLHLQRRPCLELHKLYILLWGGGFLGSSRTMHLQRKNLLFLPFFCCLFSISNNDGYHHHFQKFWCFLITSIRVGGGGSKWIMMTAVIQTDCVIVSAGLFGTCKMRNYKCQTAVNMGAKYLNMFSSWGKSIVFKKGGLSVNKLCQPLIQMQEEWEEKGADKNFWYGEEGGNQTQLNSGAFRRGRQARQRKVSPDPRHAVWQGGGKRTMRSLEWTAF